MKKKIVLTINQREHSRHGVMARLKAAQKLDGQCFPMQRRRRLSDRLHLLVRRPSSRADDCNFKLLKASERHRRTPCKRALRVSVCPVTSAQIITFNSDFYSSTLRPHQPRSSGEAGGGKGRDRNINTWFSSRDEERDEEKNVLDLHSRLLEIRSECFFLLFLSRKDGRSAGSSHHSSAV